MPANQGAVVESVVASGKVSYYILGDANGGEKSNMGSDDVRGLVLL